MDLLPAEQGEVQVAPLQKELADAGESSLVTLAALRESRQVKQAELDRLRAGFDPNVDSELRLQQLERIRTMQAEVQKLEYDFESIATGIDVRAFDLGVEEETNLVEELTKFLRPVLSELRQATKSPRELERLTKVLEIAEEQEVLAQTAIENVALLLERAQAPRLREALEHSLKSWRERLEEIRNQRTVADFQLKRYTDNRPSVLESTRGALAKFFKTRGLNLFLALGAFVGILLGLRLVYRLVRRLLPQLAKEERPFYARLVDVLFFAFSGLVAIAGALLVLYSAGDFALLGLAILALLGLGWASKTALPVFFEQINLLLNLGTVRENERVIVGGLPYLVLRISLHASLSNPALTGARLRLPLRDLPNLRSRPCVADEAWFPTQGGDWVLLPDQRLGRVERQTLEVVRLRLKGGSLFTYPTTDFLTLGVENLSSGFRITQRFGVDYAHQALSTREIPAAMRARLETELGALTKEGQLRRVSVEFLEAASSSLDYAVLCDFDGSAAGEHNDLRRAIQRILVDACTDEGWSIPFTQVTLHQAAGG
jgi:small-conductance mechanosensitive channel